MRAVLSALGISVGIATLVVVTGIPASAQQALMQELSALGTNTLRAARVPQLQPPVPLPQESVEMVRRIGPVSAASATANTETTVRRSDRADPNEATGLTVLASKLDLLPAINGHVSRGRFLDAATERFPTAVLGSVAAIRLGVTEPGHQVLIENRWFTVIGTLATTPLSPEIDRAVLIGWPAATAELAFDGHPTTIYLKATESAIEAVRSVLPATVNPQRPDAVQVTRPSDALAAKRLTEEGLSALFLALSGVALLVGGIGVANTMVVSVLERRKEIGLRRALGASRNQIRGQFLTESVALAGLGGSAGVLIGITATVGYAARQDWPVIIPVPAVAGGLGGALVIGVLAGVYPAIRAARLPPTEALA
jgi:putative ABC transport system permease protein